MIALAQRLRTLPLRAMHFVQVPVVAYAPNPNWVQWSDQASKLFRAIAHDKKLPHTTRQHGGGTPGAAASRPASPEPRRSQREPRHDSLARQAGQVARARRAASPDRTHRSPA